MVSRKDSYELYLSLRSAFLHSGMALRIMVDQLPEEKSAFIRKASLGERDEVVENEPNYAVAIEMLNECKVKYANHLTEEMVAQIDKVIADAKKVLDLRG